MHPEVTKFIKAFEEKALRIGQYRKTLGKYEIFFLQYVWGPVFQYNFDGLSAEYPLKDFKGGDRFIDFVYTRGGIRLIIEIDGFTTHARDISPGEFSDHLMRQNDLVLAGWLILRFSNDQVEKRAVICQRQIMQAIGHWWTLSHGASSSTEMEVWALRKRLLIQYAIRQEGIIRCIDVAREFNIVNRTAHSWLTRFVKEGILADVRPNKRTVGYRLMGYSHKTG